MKRYQERHLLFHTYSETISEGYCLELIVLFVYHAVFQLCELSAVPSAGGSDEVTGDALELVYLGALAVRTFFKILISVLETAIHATVTVMVH